ncbi:uncharacterized protein BDR25DRAFT_15762 [Lindgomyces ingoldianus]|uniref:Uncharacterized protein n=1 Tax=Lindgomyces ingoldianus TaxID=673940 RepID=A0ACB6R0I8_9PLEO|nr:uncharacterized protein BDR25DRAFT_15762 [Lindgomyces ingoldianus]KAF2472605.1 hypothetical protein BDR25DRAFT_15762 [Lindgomyces ingoldianus]
MCATCGFSSLIATGPPLLRCSRCQAVYYCSKACQRADWKSHKASCTRAPHHSHSPYTITPQPSCPSSPSGFPSPVSPDIVKINLHALDSMTVYKHLIDAYRLLANESWNASSMVRPRCSLHDADDHHSVNPIPTFRHFLNEAERRNGLLPMWWTQDTKRDCEEMELRLQRNPREWRDVEWAGDVNAKRKHEDDRMAEGLRELAERCVGVQRIDITV